MSYFSRWKALWIVPVAGFVGLTFLWAGFVGLTFFWAPSFERQGGSYLLLEVDANYVKKQKLDQIRDDTRRELREARIGYNGLSTKGDAVEVRVKDTDLATALSKLRELPVGLDSNGQRSLEVADVGGGLIQLSVPEAAIAEQLSQMTEQSIQIVERRIQDFGTAKPIVQRWGADRILVQVPGLQDPTRLHRLLGSDGKMEFRMVDTSVSPEQAEEDSLPPDSELLTGAWPQNVPYVVKKRVLVSGSDLIDAQVGIDQRTNEPVINFRFNSPGAHKFAQATAENVGLRFAIVLDGFVISAPRINEPITGGRGQISGSFTAESANDLVILLRAGALPAPLTVVEERTVGPGLGRILTEGDRIRATGHADPTVSERAP